MRKLREFVQRFGGLFNKRRKDQQLDDEIESHLQLHIEDNLRLGMTPEEARREAIIKLGGIESTKEAYRDQRGLPVLETLWQDIRYGARMLRKNPGFTAMAVLTLALGIGATTAIFSIVNTVLLKPLPYREPERLVRLFETYKEPGWERTPVSPAAFLDWRAQNQMLEDIAAIQWGSFNVTGSGQPERLPGFRVSASLFPMLGVNPILGRQFTSEEDRFGNHHVALISHRLWMRRFGGDANAVGKSIVLDGESYTIVGVMPAGFRFMDGDAEFWTPAAFTPKQITNRGNHGWTVVARLKPGVTLEQARTEINSIAARLAKRYAGQGGSGSTLISLQEELVGGSRRLLLLLSCAVGVILLIACVNVANLLLARAAARQKEFAIRAAVGAERRRLFRQLLTESLLLASLGGVLGCVCAYWSIRTLSAITASILPRMEQVQLDLPVLGFALIVSLFTGIAFGLVPAFHALRVDLDVALKDSSRGSDGFGRSRLRSSLVVAELALSLVLLIGAGLFIRSFVRLYEVNPGFNPTRVLTVAINLPDKKYRKDADRAEFFRKLLERAQALPGVQSVGAIFGLPLSGGQSQISFAVEGRPQATSDQPKSAGYRQISPNYFRTMGTPLVKGRDFDERDTTNVPAVVIVNEAFVRLALANEEPLGRRLQIGGSDHRPAEIIGVVRDVRHESLAVMPGPEMYVPFAQHCWGLAAVVVRTATEPISMANALRNAVMAIDPEQPIYNVRTMDAVVSEALAGRRVQTWLLGAFGAVAVTLAAIGLYGVISYSVSQRTREIGVRMALGAPRRTILALVIGQGVRLALMGASIGLLIAFTVTRAIRSLLYEVGPSDPPTFISVSLLLVAVALFACWLPAWRAAKVDPMVALRYE